MQAHPEIAQTQEQLKEQIKTQILSRSLGNFKTTNFNDTMYVPLVFHIVHDYGQEYVTDTAIYQAVREINEMFNSIDPDTVGAPGTAGAGIILPYRRNIPGTNKTYRAQSRIIFKLATKDPQGNPTHGITRRRSYQTYLAGDQAKYDIWPTQSYMNIWIIRAFDSDHTGAAAYAYKPSAAQSRPWTDGVIGTLQNNYINYDNTLAHELGHSLNLDHTWGGTNQPGVDCGDDGIDDTPPTYGHPPNSGNCSQGNLFDTRCVYFNADSIGKINLDGLTDITSTLVGEGIRFNALNKIHLDSVYFYPTVVNQPYQIVLKRGNAVVGTHNGTTIDNKVTRTKIKRDTITYLQNFATADMLTNTGIKFLTYDSLTIKSVYFNPVDSGEAYEIVLKRNGTVIDNYAGITWKDPANNANWTLAPVDFTIPFTSVADTYSIEFGVNPGVYRDTLFNASVDTLYPSMRFASDMSNSKYNYFFQWTVETYDYKQVARLGFIMEENTDYSLEFSLNPGAKRDLGSTPTAQRFLFDAIQLTKDTTGPYYNFFYNWHFRHGDYYKTYSAAEWNDLFWTPGDSLATVPRRVNYPDTVNSQNVMDYTYCSRMFTYLQAVHMREALNNTTENRNQLITPENLAITGALDPWPDLAPIADFSVPSIGNIANRSHTGFICPGQQVLFTNRSWNDTVTSVNWTFSNGADVPSSSSMTTVNNKFSQPGWVTVSLEATSNAGSSTTTKSNLIYVADGDNVVDPTNYVQDFNPSGDLDKYPLFNYYENETKWEVINHAGMYDNTSIKYNNYDLREWPNSLIGTPRADYDDFFTPAFDLTKLGGQGEKKYLNFFTAGAYRTNVVSNMNDTLEIAYSGNCNTWTVLKRMTRLEIANNGLRTENFTPSGFWEWKGQSIDVTNISGPSAQRVYFRFRYKPGVNVSKQNFAEYLKGTGNNFYIDRIQLAKWTTDVAELESKETGIVLAPNPTTGSTNIIVKDAKSATAQVQVTDITGKVVYVLETKLNQNMTSIEIPENVIAVKGIYLVQVTTGTTKFTEKLVVY